MKWPHLGIKCKLETKPKNRHAKADIKYVVDYSKGDVLVSCQPGVKVFPIDEEIKVCDEKGEEIQPSGRFYRTAETINPYHIIFDLVNPGAVLC